MELKLKIFDSDGNQINIGDKLLIQSKRNDTLTFYATAQLINGQIFPFDQFVYDRIIKVDEIPTDCKYVPAKIEQGFPEYWMNPNVELHLIEKGKLDKWRLDTGVFNMNKFYKIEPTGICYKTNSKCIYGCKGLCKESC